MSVFAYLLPFILVASHLSHFSGPKKWSKKPLVTEARLVHAMAATKEEIFISEGRLLSGGASDKVLSLDPSLKIQREKMGPIAREGHSLDAIENGFLWSFGGKTDQALTNNVWEYTGGEWRQLTIEGERPAPRWGHASTYHDGLLWVFGGKGDSSDAFYNDLWSFDGTDWTLHKSDLIPAPRYGSQLGVYNGALVLYGGRNHSGEWFTDTWTYNREWKKLEVSSNEPIRPEASVGFSLITTPHDLYLVGGITKGNTYQSVWKYNGERWDLDESIFPEILDFPAGCYHPTRNSLLITGTCDGQMWLFEYPLDKTVKS